MNNIVFNNLICLLYEMLRVSSLFSVKSSKDFSRNRILNFKDTLIIILGMAGGSLNKEIYDYFKCKTTIPTTSAFVQARAKILPEAFQYLFTEFNRECNTSKKYKGYQLLAADGTDLNIPKNSPINLIKRRQSLLPLSGFHLLSSKSRNHSLNKADISSKKSFQKGFSTETIPENIDKKGGEENNKRNKIVGSVSEKNKLKEVQNNYFINLTKNIYTDELHMKKSNIVRNSQIFNNEPKYPFISNKTVINKNRRMSAGGNNLFLPLFNRKKKLETTNNVRAKDILNPNSNFKTITINNKFKEKIGQIFENPKLTNDEKEIILNYYINKNIKENIIQKKESSKGNGNSPILRKKKKKKKKGKSIKFKEEIKVEDEKTEKEDIEKNKDNNLNTSGKKHKKTKIKFLTAFLCCLGKD